MSSTLEASLFMEKNYSDNLRSITNTGNNLTMKQMFDISEKLIVGQSDEIYGETPINWEDPSWKQLSLVGDEEVISLSHAKANVFSDSVLGLGKMNQNAESNYVSEEKCSRVHHNTELWTQLMVSQWNSSGILPLRPMILRKKIYCKSTKNEWKGSHNKIVWLRFVLVQDSQQQLESDSTSWQKTLKNSLTFTE